MFLRLGYPNFLVAFLFRWFGHNLVAPAKAEVHWKRPDAGLRRNDGKNQTTRLETLPGRLGLFKTRCVLGALCAFRHFRERFPQCIPGVDFGCAAPGVFLARHFALCVGQVIQVIVYFLGRVDKWVLRTWDTDTCYGLTLVESGNDSYAAHESGLSIA